ncbi:MAG: hypothetical protein RL226_1975 [Bacteroidota bacterium]
MNIALVFALTLAASCSNPATETPAETQGTTSGTATEQVAAAEQTTIAKNVSTAEFQQLMQDHPDAILLDVRTPGEVAGGMIPNAQNIDFRDPGFAAKIGELAKDKPVLVYCASGNRSGQAMRMMADQGFTEVYNLSGGFGAWSSEGLPTNH